MKSLLESKTFWFAVLKFALGILTLSTATFGQWLPATVVGAILSVTAVIDVILRLNTTTAITGIASTNP